MSSTISSIKFSNSPINSCFFFMHRLRLQLLILLLHFALFIHAHQAICFPRPISRIVACRISSNSYCPGPCPNTELRLDQTKDNPSIRTKRGAKVFINILRNNHDGGFVRWSLVNLKDKMNKVVHEEKTFLITCADLRPTKCKKKTAKRDCTYDRTNEYFKHLIQIPENIPDGVYVLGWAWYGGGRVWGMFGDYYDCLYIQIKGGVKLKAVNKLKFHSGPSRTGRNGFCKATVNRLGICFSEPCRGGGSFTKMLKPYQFTGKYNKSKLIPARYYRGYQIREKTKKSPVVTTISIFNPFKPDMVYAQAHYHQQMVYMKVTKKTPIGISCEVDNAKGNVQYVSFFVHGFHVRNDLNSPFTLSGDWPKKGFGRKRIFGKWQYDYSDKVMSVTCKAKGYDGTVDYLSMELSTSF